ncbi:MAG: hypothetical protein ACMUEM_00475 [Flavobacteriales bacterium AspAUS03]
MSKEEVFEYARLIARKEGIFVGISIDANLSDVVKKFSELSYLSRILTFNYDTGKVYLSI